MAATITVMHAKRAGAADSSKRIIPKKVETGNHPKDGKDIGPELSKAFSIFKANSPKNFQNPSYRQIDPSHPLPKAVTQRESRGSTRS